ncbi:hypothetical protein U0030_15890 [Brevundimonas bullata]|uniref:hypothetical protein n=1 Tax=Brevundimonas bullata TaxID=13160 RepID=UPI000E0ADA2E|nr:hypothetical protein [Brevundimonas bullata]WQE36719.1 hypothetical protein U0030_15890 [Brevundimonas bullata]
MRPPEYAQPDGLYGASEIAAHLFGDETRVKKVYNLHHRVRPPHRFPIYRMAGQLVALRSEIKAWFALQREAQSSNDAASQDEAA